MESADHQRAIRYTIKTMVWKVFTALLLLVSQQVAAQPLELSTSEMALDWHSWVTIAVFILVFIALVKELVSPDITMFVGACVLLITGVLGPQEFLVGFSRPIIFTLAMLFIVAKSMEVNGILNFLAHKTLPKTGSYRRQLTFLMVPVSVVSAFLNNTPLVLMLTPVVRKWALDHKLSPSRYLIPVSFAAILGGMCTLIGTAGNLIVNGLMREVDVAAGFAFFDLAWIGVPSLIVGTLYILLVGGSWLPHRKDPAVSASAESREFTVELMVLEECPLVNMKLQEASRRYFDRDYLIEIQRGPQIIDSPGPNEVIHAGDHLVITSELSRLASLHAIKGLQSLADPTFRLDISSPHFAEVVVAVNSWLIGKSVKKAYFRTRYGASVAAVIRGGKRVPGAVGDIILHPGDALLLLANQPWKMDPSFANDLYAITPSKELPVFAPRRVLFIGGVLIAMVVVATAGIPIMLAALGAAALLVITRNISLQQIPQAIDWHLLLLVASAFALGAAMYSTGVAYVMAKGVLYLVGTQPHMLIGGIFLATMLITEVITNAAAALMLFPIALEMGFLAGYDTLSAIKAIGVTIAIASSSSFLTPIGYQTNTIVYAPGGYRFTDYARIGLVLSVSQLVIATWLIPIIWPLSH